MVSSCGKEKYTVDAQLKKKKTEKCMYALISVQFSVLKLLINHLGRVTFRFMTQKSDQLEDLLGAWTCGLCSTLDIKGLFYSSHKF